MKSAKPTILVVEDFQLIHTNVRDRFEGRANILSAYTVSEAEMLFSEYGSSIDAIVMDACVPGDEPNTIELVREMRRTFTGPMIAISGMQEYLDDLVKAGCNKVSSKSEVGKVLENVLFLDHQARTA